MNEPTIPPAVQALATTHPEIREVYQAAQRLLMAYGGWRRWLRDAQAQGYANLPVLQTVGEWDDIATGPGNPDSLISRAIELRLGVDRAARVLQEFGAPGPWREFLEASPHMPSVYGRAEYLRLVEDKLPRLYSAGGELRQWLELVAEAPAVMLLSLDCEELAATDELPCIALTTPTLTQPPKHNHIVWTGTSRSYRVGDRDIYVTDGEDSLLQAFLEYPSLDTPGLKRATNLSEPGRVFRKLEKNYDGAFAPFMTRPQGGRRNAGGYSIRVRQEPTP